MQCSFIFTHRRTHTSYMCADTGTHTHSRAQTTTRMQASKQVHTHGCCCSCRGETSLPHSCTGELCVLSLSLSPRLVQASRRLSRSQVVWCVGERHGVTAGNVGWVMAKNSHSRREISVGVSDRRFVGSQKRRSMFVTRGARVSRRRPSDNNFVTSCTRDLQLP